MSQHFLGMNAVLGQGPQLADQVPIHSSKTEDIERVVDRIQHELRSLLLERAAIVKRIGMVKHTITGLIDVFGADIPDGELRNLLDHRSGGSSTCPHPGLTEACRHTLMESSQPLTTRQLCVKIQETHPSILVKHQQPMASVTVVLRRLVSYGEVQDGVNERHGRTWSWIGPRKRDEVLGGLSSETRVEAVPTESEGQSGTD